MSAPQSTSSAAQSTPSAAAATFATSPIGLTTAAQTHVTAVTTPPGFIPHTGGLSSIVSSPSAFTGGLVMPQPFTWSPPSAVATPSRVSGSSSRLRPQPSFAGSTILGSVPPGLAASMAVPHTNMGYNPLPSNLSLLQSTTAFSAINVKNIVTTVLSVVEDYLPWRTQFESFIVSNGLLGMLDGSIIMPDMYISDNMGRQSFNHEYVAWLKIDQTIRSWIFATLSKDLLVEVHDLQFSALIWERLQGRFMSASLARSMELKRLLTTIKKTDSKSMDEYLRDIKLIADSLAAINSPVSNHDLVQHTLIGVIDEEYESFITAMTHYPGHLTFDELRSKLLVQEQCVRARRASTPDMSSHQAFTAQATPSAHNSNGSSSSASSRSNNNNYRGGRNNNYNNNHNNNSRGGRSNRFRGRGRGNRNQQQGSMQHQTSTHTQPIGSGMASSKSVLSSNSMFALSSTVSHDVYAGTPSVEGVSGSHPPSVCQICYLTGHSAQTCPSRYVQQSMPALAAMPMGETNDSLWYPDSGASSHMTNNEGSHFGASATPSLQ